MEEANRYAQLMQQLQNPEALSAVESVRRFILNMQGKTEHYSSFADESFNESDFIAKIIKHSSLHFSHFYFINKMQSLYLWGDYDNALLLLKQANHYLKYSVGMLHTTEHYFYAGLILAKAQKPKQNLPKIKQIIKKFSKWAINAPSNFKHKLLLLQAEEKRIEGNFQQCIALYHAAAENAEENGYLQNQAIALEGVAKYYLSMADNKAARACLQEAEYYFRRWGATAKANQLINEFGALFSLLPSQTAVQNNNNQPVTTTRTYSTGTNYQNLNIETIIKATQAISSEINMEALLQKLMHTIIENAGAECGCLIKCEQGQFSIQAKTAKNSQKIELFSEKNIAEVLPFSIIQLVFRTKNNIVLDNATLDERFYQDAYIAENKTKSILCAPIITQGELTDIIYLENNLATAAFNPEHLTIVKVLVAQAAISIRNARYYDDLEGKVRERTHELQIEQEKAEKLLLNILPVAIADELKDNGYVEPMLYESVSVLFTDFVGFTRIASTMQPKELLAELDDYFSYFDAICDEYQLEKLKTIGDAFMCVCGLPNVNFSHPIDSCLGALKMRQYIRQRGQDKKDSWGIRLGIHTGEVVAGVIGKRKFAYDVWGDAVNVASRLESNSVPGKINISESTYNHVQRYFDCEFRGELDVKNRGKLSMYFLNGLKPEYCQDESGEIPNQKLWDGLRVL